MKKYFLILLIILIPASFLKGQTICGTQITPAQFTLESTLSITPAKANESLPRLDMELAVSVFIVKNEKGSTGIATSAVYSAIDRLNSAFSPIKLKFRICALNNIENYQFDTLGVQDNLPDLLIQNNSSNTINLYLVSKITDKNDSLLTGMAFMPGDQKDAIILDKDKVAGNEIIHQFGHFFNLYHTDETKFGRELVEDPGCSKKGDCCCDTPADPGIKDFIYACEYTGTAKDDANKFYIPVLTNYMSVGNESCRCSFTNDQYKRMVNAVQNLKKNLW